jgi:hypothetical protein
MLFLVLFFVLLFLSAYQALTVNAWDVSLYVSVAVFGGAAIYFAALLRVKRR